MTETDIGQQIQKLKEDGIVSFITFHPSFSYEEFIEGLTFDIKSKDEEQEDAKYVIKDGIFKEMCSKSLLLALQANNIDTNCLRNVPQTLKEDFTKNGIWNSLFSEYKNLTCGENKKINASVFWEKADTKEHRVVLIIDEINRGDVSKIFGELITLIEIDKRLGGKEELTCILPMSRDELGVPPNLYIIGTMNTADRSLVQLDVALRRRFEFEPLWPKLDANDPEIDPELKAVLQNQKQAVQYLVKINEKIREHPDLGQDKMIGHSYLFKIQNGDLKYWLKKDILPLLYEYSHGSKDIFIDLLKGINGDINAERYPDWYNFDSLIERLIPDETKPT